MSSADQAAFVPLAAPRSRINGHAFAIPAAVIAIISFFLPWLLFADAARSLASLTGLQIASGALISTGESEIFSGSPIAFLVPASGAIVLLSVILSIRRGFVKELDGFVAIGLSLLTVLIIWGRFNEAQKFAEESGISIHLQVGLLGAYLSLLGLIVAGAMYLRTVGQRKPEFQATLGAWSFMSPATFLVVVFFFVPAILLFILSLTDLASHNFSDPWTFIGLANYKRLFNDAFFPKILGNTFRYVILTLGIFNVGMALFIALLTSLINRKAAFFYRLIWLLPRMTPSVVYIVMWQRYAQTPPYGIINQLLGLAGIESNTYWLSETPWLFVILVNGFVGASFGLIIFSSAIEAIPKDLFTAAKVDGATTWQTIRDITLPQMRWPLLFVTTYQTLSLLVSFEYILLLTEGGPGLFTTEVWSLTAYKRALQTYFGSHAWGYASAWGFILVAIAVVMAIIYLRAFRFNELVEEPKIDVL